MRRLAEVGLVVIILIVLAVMFSGGCIAPDLRQYNVLIETVKLDPTWYGQPGYSIGSGIVIDANGLVLTAAHVISGANKVQVTLHDNRVFVVDLNDVYIDEEKDVAYLNLNIPMETYIPLADSNDIDPGDRVVGVGNPGGLLINIEAKGKVKYSRFKRLFLGEDTECFLIDMDVYPGDSGGGVYHDGQLFGIMVRSDGKGLAIIVSSNTCRKVLRNWKKRAAA